MRIISGRFKGRNLKVPEGARPTQNKVRKAIFDILGDISGLSFLDLFAGGGAVGIEAFSYGAGKVILVENNGRIFKVLKENVANICPDEESRDQILALVLDTQKAISRFHENKESFDIIFLDPPYYQDMAKKTLQTLDVYDILTPSGIIFVQHYSQDILPKELTNLALFKQYKYGDTRLSLYKGLSGVRQLKA